jgi:hypothetical protein
VKQGLLARHFRGVAVKKLSAVEADTATSNQHEFNGVSELKKLLGSEKQQIQAKFVWLSDEQEAISEEGFVTWYDAREAHPTRSEHRLYFQTTPVSELAKAGDTLFFALRTDESALVIIVPADSTIQNQLLWLFGLVNQPELQFKAVPIAGDSQSRLEFAVRYIFDELGIEAEEPEVDLIDAALARFGKKFPKMKEFSAFARSTLPDVSAHDNVDEALLAWMDREELLFRRLERAIVDERLRAGFVRDDVSDVDGFLQFSLSVQNRRKARAGAALENHLEHLFQERRILYGRGCETENRYKPDFLFPGCDRYRDPACPEHLLTMLGAKSTLKERWRQILSEADRIKVKHLLTLSPGVSVNQTDQMKAGSVQLVMPAGLHQTYQPAQRSWLMNVSQFVELVSSRQKTQ